MEMLSRSLRALGMAAGASMIVACASAGGAGPGAVLKDGNYPLAERQSVVLARGATLTYDRVEDSRCPPNVTCIWPGKLVYHFTLSKDGAVETFALSPGQPEYSTSALGDARIVLDEAAIPPPAAAQAAPAPHPVTLKLVAK
jgi:hypothetical protein